MKGILHKVYLDSGLSIEKITDKLTGHSLDSLWSKVFNEIIGKYPLFNEDLRKKDLKNIGKMIKELHSVDDSSMTYRYPFDTSLVENVYGDGKESFGIDFIHLQKEIDNLHSRLYYFIYEAISVRNE